MSLEDMSCVLSACFCLCEAVTLIMSDYEICSLIVVDVLS